MSLARTALHVSVVPLLVHSFCCPDMALPLARLSPEVAVLVLATLAVARWYSRGRLMASRDVIIKVPASLQVRLGPVQALQLWLLTEIPGRHCLPAVFARPLARRQTRTPKVL